MSRGPDIKITTEVVLDQYRCDKCGRFWAVEHDVSSECPHCAAVVVGEHQSVIARLNRRISSLQGALTRKKGKAHA